ncbi:hypothetical protein E2562_035636 [Oryza meyeriana var. granulata]|uniref:Uncharacterized protein n=1 Tax=Oryza meyeriana var. granulata TaxID=110450 RepID=A0A6G1E737_9ORYZ|nr:hypothetical protein E2562_035636 [Oryza meyeriana var. granulata]
MGEVHQDFASLRRPVHQRRHVGYHCRARRPVPSVRHRVHWAIASPNCPVTGERLHRATTSDRLETPYRAVTSPCRR